MATIAGSFEQLFGPLYKGSPVYRNGIGILTDPVGTVGIPRHRSIWDTAYGTDSGAVANFLSGKSSDTYWGTDLVTALRYRRSEKNVYEKVLALSKAKTHGYIKNLDTGEIKHFQFNPETLEYDRSVNYVDNSGPQLAYPKTQFVNGNSREFDVELFLYDRQLEPCGIIKDYMMFFGQFLTPEENVANWKRPPELLFFYGYFIRKCVLTNFKIKIEEMDESGTPTMARFTLTLKQVGVV